MLVQFVAAPPLNVHVDVDGHACGVRLDLLETDGRARRRRIYDAAHHRVGRFILPDCRVKRSKDDYSIRSAWKTHL